MAVGERLRRHGRRQAGSDDLQPFRVGRAALFGVALAGSALLASVFPKPAAGAEAGAAATLPRTVEAGTRAVAARLRPEPLRHTYLTGSNPAADAVVEGPVTEIRLAFNTPVQRPLSIVTVTGADDFSIPVGRPASVPDADENEFRVELRQPLAPGHYTVQWRTVGPDDHPVQGSFAFEVAPGVPDRLEIAEEVLHEEDDLPAQDEHAEEEHALPLDAPSPPAPEAETHLMSGPDERVQLGIRWLFYLAIIGMIGPVAFRVAVVRPISRPAELQDLGVRALANTRNVAWIMAILALAVLPARLVLQTSAIFGSIDFGRLGTIIFETTWGTGWLLQAFFTLLFVAGLIGTGSGGRRARGWSVMAIGALGMALIPAITGHAWGAETLRPIVLGSTFVHVLTAGIWLGGLLVLLFAGLPALRRGAPQQNGEENGNPHGRKPGFTGLSAMVNAFSRVAVLAVALLVATGVVNGWVHLGAVSDLWATGYGRAMAVKVGVALGAFALGFYNWRVVRPSLRERQEPGILRIPASIELFIGMIVLVITAVLVSQSLP